MSEQGRELEAAKEQLISFGAEGAKLTARKNSVFKIEDFQFSTPNQDDFDETSCLNDLKDFSFFTLGPVYCGAQVPHCFLEFYAEEVSKETKFILFTLPGDFSQGLEVYGPDGIAQVGTWNDKVYAIQSDKLDEFTDFMMIQTLGRTQLQKYYGVDHHDIYIDDPVLKHQGKVVTPADQIKLRVFTVFSKRGQMEPFVDFRTGMLSFKVGPPDQNKVTYLNQVVQIQNKEVQ